MTNTSLTNILKHWPLITAAAIGLMGFTTLKADVGHLEVQVAEQVSDHDRIVRMETKQDRMAEDVTEMKSDIKEIAKAVK